VVAHNYEEPKHVFHPYQVQLQDGSLIFAPEDSDEYIQANWTKPRFEIGTCVLCKYGDQWVKGTVVMHNCEASMGVFHPYQVKLHHGAWVYVPADEDTFIQRAAFAVGDRVRVRNLTQKNDILGTIVGQDSGRLRVALGDEGGGAELSIVADNLQPLNEEPLSMVLSSADNAWAFAEKQNFWAVSADDMQNLCTPCKTPHETCLIHHLNIVQPNKSPRTLLPWLRNRFPETGSVDDDTGNRTFYAEDNSAIHTIGRAVTGKRITSAELRNLHCELFCVEPAKLAPYKYMSSKMLFCSYTCMRTSPDLACMHIHACWIPRASEQQHDRPLTSKVQRWIDRVQAIDAKGRGNPMAKCVDQTTNRRLGSTNESARILCEHQDDVLVGQAWLNRWLQSIKAPGSSFVLRKRVTSSAKPSGTRRSAVSLS
jgi:hypothetical protein